MQHLLLYRFFRPDCTRSHFIFSSQDECAAFFASHQPEFKSYKFLHSVLLPE
jgi:hypothetical protein